MTAQILKAKKGHFSQILEIANNQLGENYIDHAALSSPDTLVIVAIDETQVIGFCLGYKISKKELYLKIPGIEEAEIGGYKSFKSVAYLASIATNKKFLGKGIGSKMLSVFIDNMESDGVHGILMMGWRSSGGVNIEPLAKKFGFRAIMEVENFWRDESVSKGYSCPECIHPPCLCSSVVFAR